MNTNRYNKYLAGISAIAETSIDWFTASYVLERYKLKYPHSRITFEEAQEVLDRMPTVRKTGYDYKWIRDLQDTWVTRQLELKQLERAR